MLTLTWNCDECGETFERQDNDPSFLRTPPDWTATRLDDTHEWRYACPSCAKKGQP